jgi:hypothetical protein
MTDNPFRYTNAACKVRCDRPARHHVLLLLSTHANHHDGSCVPSISLLMAETGYSKSAVCDAIAYLKNELKVLTYTRGWGNRYGRRSNRYRLDIAAMDGLKVEGPIVGPARLDEGPLEGDEGPPTLPLTNQHYNEPANLKEQTSNSKPLRLSHPSPSDLGVIPNPSEAGMSNKPICHEGPIVGPALEGPIVGPASIPPCPDGIPPEQWKIYQEGLNQ